MCRARRKRWITGGDWDHEAWGGDLPKKEWIDAVSGNHPVFVNRYDGHMALANSVALRLAGIDKIHPTSRGEIVKILQRVNQPAYSEMRRWTLVNNVIPEPSAKEMEEAFLRAQQHALSLGVTRCTIWATSAAGLIWILIRGPARWPITNARLFICGFGNMAENCRLRNTKWAWRWHAALGRIKGFVDGSLGSTTAWFYKPYLDAPNSTGLQVTDPQHFFTTGSSPQTKPGYKLPPTLAQGTGPTILFWMFTKKPIQQMVPVTVVSIEHAQHLTGSHYKIWCGKM